MEEGRLDKAQREAVLLRAGVARSELLAACQEAADLWAERHDSNVHDPYGLHPDDYAIGPGGEIGGGADDDDDGGGGYPGDGGGGYGGYADEYETGGAAGGGGRYERGYGGAEGGGSGGGGPLGYDDGADLGATWYPRASGHQQASPAARRR